jgi:hypothetical protein
MTSHRQSGFDRFECGEQADSSDTIQHGVEQIYRRYLGADVRAWPAIFRARLVDSTWALWTVTPASGLVAAYPNFDAREVRWRRPQDSPLPPSASLD